MDWSSWIPAVTTSSVVALLGFVGGVATKAAVEKGIGHAFETRLEELRAGFRRDEEALKAALRNSEEEIRTLRQSAMSGHAARQEVLTKRRVEACEKLWRAVLDLGRFKLISALSPALEVILEQAADSHPSHKQVREFAETMLKSSNLSEPKSFNLTQADSERPFIDPVTWALFSAYRQALMYPAAMLQMAKLGMGKEVMAGTGLIVESLKVAIPDQEKYIVDNGLGSIFHIAPILEERILASISDNLEGVDADSASVGRATRIIEIVNEAAAALDAAKRPKFEAPSLNGG